MKKKNLGEKSVYTDADSVGEEQLRKLGEEDEKEKPGRE